MLELYGSHSPIRELYEKPEFRLAWDNDLAFHIARSVGRLRHYRGLTQSQLAEAAGTTQARIARIEGAGQNLTIMALARIVDALGGRVRFAIEPAELDTPQMPPWYECLARGLVLPSPQRWHNRIVMTYEARPGQPSTAIAGWGSAERTPDLAPERLMAKAHAELPATQDQEAAFASQPCGAESELVGAWS